MTLDPALDLRLERVVDVPVERVWAAWTEPDHLKKWFTPAPWKTVECRIHLKPGGQFRTVMQSPEKNKFPMVGCYLEVVLHRRLVWTTALSPGWRPAAPALVFTAVIEMEPQGNATRYSATALHRDEETRKKHEGMGFHQGWGKALDQLVEAFRRM